MFVNGMMPIAYTLMAETIPAKHRASASILTMFFPPTLTARRNATYVVTVTVANDGDTAAEVPVFVRAEGGERTKRMLVKGKSKAVDRVEVPTAPSEAVVNDGSVPESNMNNNAMAVAPPK